MVKSQARKHESPLIKYKYLSICPKELEQVNLLFAAKYPSLESAQSDAEVDRRTISNFLGGIAVRRKHFLNLCKLLGIAPLAAAGLQAGATLAKPASELLELPKDMRDFEVDGVSKFLQRQAELKRVVQITNHNTNIAQFASKEMPPERLGGANPDPRILKGHNYLASWEGTGSLEQYLKMRSLIEADGYIPGYVHRLIRPSDGALVEYACDFHLVRDLLGSPVRITSSDPKDFHVISA